MKNISTGGFFFLFSCSCVIITPLSNENTEVQDLYTYTHPLHANCVHGRIQLC